ncbi:MAG: hypothetical protein JWN34_2900 [Bryobacterales bacterium]|nr:hypothetical protein [Bryobacterales bacterium]
MTTIGHLETALTVINTCLAAEALSSREEIALRGRREELQARIDGARRGEDGRK